MDKEEFLKYLNVNENIEILYQYCIEKGKKVSDINGFITLLQSIDPFGKLLSNCISDAIKYYKDKFNIISIIDSTGQTIINY